MRKNNIKKTHTISNVLEYAKNYLLSVNNNYLPFLDAIVLLIHTTGKSKVFLLTHLDYVLSDSEFSFFLSLLEKRAGAMPVKYIIGSCEFMGLTFKVNQSVLIPRCDTEILVETALNVLGSNKNIIADMGCGSGCIAVSIAHYSPNTNVIAVDISKDALTIAKENAISNDVNEKISFVNSNLFDNIPNYVILDAIVSNPPYIPNGEIDKLTDDVKCYEPLTALCGGDDGLDFYRAISFYSKKYLKNNGNLIFEIGFDQFEDVKNILLDNGYVNIKVFKDLAGCNRVVSAINTVGVEKNV